MSAERRRGWKWRRLASLATLSAASWAFPVCEPYIISSDGLGLCI